MSSPAVCGLLRPFVCLFSIIRFLIPGKLAFLCLNKVSSIFSEVLPQFLISLRITLKGGQGFMIILPP